MAPIPEITPAVRARLQKCFEYGNQKMQIGDNDYATEMFAQCVVGDPSNLLYMNSFIANLRIKFGNVKKKSSFSFLKKAAKAAPIGKSKDLKTTIQEGVEKLRRDPWDGLGFLRFLNVNLAILNLLPIPVLDGGLILFSLIALVFRRRVPDFIVRYLSLFFMVVLIGLMGILILRDSWRSYKIHTYNPDDEGAATNVLERADQKP